MSNSTPTINQLKHAIAVSEQIEKLQAELASLFGGSAKAAAPAKAAPAVKARKKGGMSAEGRARIVAAQKARWAKIKGQKAASAPAKAAAAPKKKKGGISPEGLARIKAAQKARWAKFKKAKA